MRFAELATEYEKLESIAKRLEIRAVLEQLLRRVSPDELGPIVYLMQGELRPAFEGIRFGMADSLAQRAVELATGAAGETVRSSLQRTGDLGTTASELLAGQPPGTTGTPLELLEVYRGLSDLAGATGSGSQEAKVASMAGLLARASPTEAKYLVRLLLGKLRLGVRDMTLLDALAVAFADGSKDARAEVEAAFNRSSDLGLVAGTLAAKGIPGVAAIGIQIGRPVRPMLAERSVDLKEMLDRLGGKGALEFKYDGLRVQAHLPRQGPVKLFSRKLEDISIQFPELVEALPQAVQKRPSIVEGECVPVDPETDELRPFQEVSRRRGRKYDLDRLRQEVPVRLLVFDVLLDEGGPTMARDFLERRKILSSLVQEGERVRLAEQEVVHSLEAAQRFYLRAIEAGCEGVIGKSIAPGSAYRAGARGFWWIKYKREYAQGLADSVDAVVVGAFFGKGRRGGGYGALLCAVFNPQRDRFETFCKVGSGFDDATLADLPRRLSRWKTESPPANVDSGIPPDVWLRPGAVLEIRGAELTLSPVHRAAFGQVRPEAGLALRFPRFTGRFREDKGADQATTTAELISLYRTQIRRVARSSEGGDEVPAPGDSAPH